MSKTKLGQVVFPPKDFELIEEITIEEYTSAVLRTQEPDGTAYRFAAIMLFVRSSSNVTASTIDLYCLDQTNVSIHGSKTIRSEDKFVSPTLYEVKGGFLTCTFNNGTNFENTLNSAWGTTFKPTSEYIAKIRLHALQAGVTVQIYGIRKE